MVYELCDTLCVRGVTGTRTDCLSPWHVINFACPQTYILWYCEAHQQVSVCIYSHACKCVMTPPNHSFTNKFIHKEWQRHFLSFKLSNISWPQLPTSITQEVKLENPYIKPGSIWFASPFYFFPLSNSRGLWTESSFVWFFFQGSHQVRPGTAGHFLWSVPSRMNLNIMI